MLSGEVCARFCGYAGFLIDRCFFRVYRGAKMKWFLFGVSWIVHEGRISIWSLEIHVIDHCNLWCEYCCMLLFYLVLWYVDLEDVIRDF